VDPIFILRGARHSRCGHHQGHHLDTSKDTTIHPRRVDSRRSACSVHIFTVGRSPGGPWLGGRRLLLLEALVVRAERASLSRQAGDEMGRANDQRFVSGGQVSCFLTLEALALRRRDRGFFLIVVQIAHVRARRPARAWQRHVISFLACHAMPCHAMPAVVHVLYLTRPHYLACCCRPVLPPAVLLCFVQSCRV
jgi:hypothetical protein